MLNFVVTGLVVFFGLHIVLKMMVFLLPYRLRRRALDRQYGDKPGAGDVGDVVTLVLTVLSAALLLWRGVEAVSFLGGLWIGATLIQLYFHRFHHPLAQDRAPPPVTSPLKWISYAIQDMPWRAWPEVVVLVVLAVVSLALIATRHPGPAS